MRAKQSRQSVKRLAKSLVRTRLPIGDAEKHLLSVAEELWYRLDTPTSLGLSLCLKYGDILSILRHKVRPDDYLTSDEFFLDYQSISFLAKAPLSAVSPEERVAAAKEKFWAAEEDCRLTNARFRSQCAEGSNPRLAAILFAASRKIAHWLGSPPTAGEWATCCRFGPGSDDLTSGPAVSAYHKLSGLSATPDFADGALCLALDHPAWAAALVGGVETDRLTSLTCSLSPSNKVMFVPKTALIDRTIAVEPRMNIFAQLGLGTMLRRRLKRFAKLDLDDQQPNRFLAQLGSGSGSLATVDLVSASDTIAREFVRSMLPEPWYNALDWVRSKTGSLDGEVFWYEKFSSMGNGYTFELESMLFYALTLAVCETLSADLSAVRVFGDDIVCPVECLDLLEEVLTFCGFRFNKSKTYKSGLFRESCGADFFDATNVRPFFQKEIPTDVPALYRLANGIRRASFRSGAHMFCDRRFRPAWLRTVRRIPEPLRHCTAVGSLKNFGRQWLDIEVGDGGLLLNQDESLSTAFTRFNRDAQRGWFVGNVLSKPFTYDEVNLLPDFVLAFGLYSIRDGSPPLDTPRTITGRGRRGYYLTDRVQTLSFVDLGPWA